MCVICLSDENLDTVTLCCYNIVHKLCLNNWLINNNTCPMCRNEHIKHLLQNISQPTLRPSPRPTQRTRQTFIHQKLKTEITQVTIIKNF